jgi:uncharacterized protein (DUF4415 family)
MNNTNLKPPFTRPLTAKELAELPDSEIDLSDIPEIGEDFWREAILMQPGDWKKPKITIRLDADIIAFFKAMGPAYQTRMDEVLKTYVEAMRKP